MIGLMKAPELDEGQKKLIAEKRAEFERIEKARRKKFSKKTTRTVQSFARSAIPSRRHHDGWVYDLSLVWRFQVRLI